MNNIHRFFIYSRKYGLQSSIVSVAYYLDADRVHNWCLKNFWAFDPNEEFDFHIIEVDVDSITHTEQFPFQVRGPNAIIGFGEGNWDSMANIFTQTEFFRSIEQRFREGKKWERTPLYQKSVNKIKNGAASWNGCESMSDIKSRCEYIDELYDDIKKNGYQSNINERWTKSVRGTSVPDEIRLAVTRDGRYIRCASGRHRLAISKILGINRIPAILQIIHKDCDDDFKTIRKVSA